jgi:hypothetical protein
LEEKSTLPLLCSEAFDMLGLSKESKKYLAPVRGKKFITLLQENTGYFFELKCKLVAVLKKPNGQSMLLFDSRHFPSVSTKQPLICLVFDSEGRLLKKTNSVDSLPRLGSRNYSNCWPQEPFWKLIGLQEEKPPDPTNRKEALDLLRHYGLEGIVNIHCPIRSVRCFRSEMWNATYLGDVHIQAFTTGDYTVGFRKYKMPQEKTEKPQEPPKKDIVGYPADMFQKNRSSSVSLKLVGLNQAVQLGLITLSELKDMSQKLGKWTGALWIELGEENKI